MWNPSDRTNRWAGFGARWLRVLAVLLALALPGAERAALAQPASGATNLSRQELRITLEKAYEVLPLRDGFVLRPRASERGVRTIELSGGTIAINGEPVNERVVRDWLGEDAGPVLQLWRMQPRDRQALFGLSAGRPPAATAEDTPEEAPEAEETPEAEEVPEAEETPEATENEIPEAPETPEAPEVPEAPEIPSSSSGSRVHVFGSISVDKGEVAQEAVAVLGSARIDGEVLGDVVAVGGSVEVNGRVGGTVTAVGGGVRLGPNAEVMRDVTSVGGSIEREEGARIHGNVAEVPLMGPRRGDWRPGVEVFPWTFWEGPMSVFWELLSLVVLGLVVCLCLLIARRSVERVDHHVATEPWVAGLVGFLAQLLFIPLLIVVTILLAITIIGCALFLLYPFVFIGLILAALIGYTAVAYRLGRVLEARFGRGFGSAYGVAMIGVVAIQMWAILAKLLGLLGGPLQFLAFILLAFSVAVEYVAWTVGIGAVLLAWFRGPNRWRRTAVPPVPLAPTPPPPPGPAPEALPLTQRWEDPDDERGWEEPPPPER